MLRLCGSLAAVLGLWTLVWLPLVPSESSAAEPQEQILGDPGAPVTIIEYSSLTCPHCAHFHTDILPEQRRVDRPLEQTERRHLLIADGDAGKPGDMAHGGGVDGHGGGG
jgi:hypothetical protein